jgi:hypothetical protein
MIGRGNRSTRRKPAPMPLCLPQTPHACPDANPGRRGGKPATNRVNYGTASGTGKCKGLGRKLVPPSETLLRQISSQSNVTSYLQTLSKTLPSR